jgi:hypothetical protein
MAVFYCLFTDYSLLFTDYGSFLLSFHRITDLVAMTLITDYF